MPLRMIRNSVVLAGVTMIVACGSTPGPSPMPPADSAFQTTVRIVSALNRELGLPQEVVTAGNGRDSRPTQWDCR